MCTYERARPPCKPTDPWRTSCGCCCCCRLLLLLLLIGSSIRLINLRAVLPSEQGFPVLIQLDLGDHDLRRVDTDLHRLSVCLLTSHALDEDAELLPVATHHLALTIMVATAEDHYLVVLTDGEGPNIVLRLQLFAQRTAHDLAPDVRRRGEMQLAVLPPGAADAGLLLHRARLSKMLQLFNCDGLYRSGLS